MELRRLVRHVDINIGKRAQRNSAADNYTSFSMLVFSVLIWMLSYVEVNVYDAQSWNSRLLEIPQKKKKQKKKHISYFYNVMYLACNTK